MDLQDFNQDVQELQNSLIDIISKIPGMDVSVESAVKANQQLLLQQQIERTQYKTQRAVKAEKTFDPNLLRYDTIIGTGG